MAATPIQQPGDFYTLREEIANAVTHGVGAALSVAGLVLLVVRAALAGDARRVICFSIFGAALLVLYLISTLYHSIPHPRAKRILQICDHCAIYGLIAGTYTPFLLIGLGGSWGWWLLGTVWAMAVCGISFKIFFTNRFNLVATLAYVAMGWLAVVAWEQLWQAIPGGAIALLIAGGLAYTGGVVFYLWERLPYNHAIWHLFVLGGSVCHFLAVALYLGPPAA
ncbi:MAG TPA: hemolysin III family protein [Herpetosiphonaceae bacterium]